MSARRLGPARPSRRTLLPTATAVALTAAAGAALLAPAAHADTSAALTLAISDATHHTVTRGHGENTFTLTVTNGSAKAQPYSGELAALPTGGPSPLEPGQVSFGVRPLTAPATGSSTMGQSPALIDEFFPQGTDARHPFQIPAGASYSWQVTVAFGADYPGNDDGLDISAVGGGGTAQKVHFDLSPALPDGRFTESFTHAVTVAPGRPGTTTLVLDNQAGGAFTKPLDTLIEVYPTGPGLGLDVRVDGVWVPAVVVQPGEWKLPQLAAGFAHGQKHDYDLRFSTTHDPGSARDIKLTSLTFLGTPIANAKTVLHEVPGSAPSAPADTSAPGATPSTVPGTAGASSSAPASAAAPAADSGTPSQSPATGSLAHTGSSHTGLFAGLAALLAAAGAALITVASRRRTRRAHL
ncbi:hypothetical protein [Streptomyces sp. Ru72]|uniref:hypothetical protein n=1 Tax=Streptomyces sp. Ru72 TaxID=2080747 RepID=UPI000CDE2276|nr:hypothetical protein [Streptomyces sp. Ru72]POX49355.1 hypothetical protein C3488_17605 [Streptomyces sp. Ru72]